MVYDVVISDEAKRFINKLDNFVKERIIKKFEDLENNPRLGKVLTANLSGFWSLRIGKYRAIYEIIDKKLIVVVVSIDHRKKVY